MIILVQARMDENFMLMSRDVAFVLAEGYGALFFMAGIIPESFLFFGWLQVADGFVTISSANVSRQTDC